MNVHVLIHLIDLKQAPEIYTSIKALANRMETSRQTVSKWHKQARYKLFEGYLIHFDTEILRIEGKRGGKRVKGQGNTANTGDWGC